MRLRGRVDALYKSMFTLLTLHSTGYRLQIKTVPSNFDPLLIVYEVCFT